MDGEISPFMEVSGGGMGSSTSLSNCIDTQFIFNVLIIILVVYVLYMISRCMSEKNMSFVEEQVELLNARQERNLR